MIHTWPAAACLADSLSACPTVKATSCTMAYILAEGEEGGNGEMIDIKETQLVLISLGFKLGSCRSHKDWTQGGEQ